MKLDWVRVEPTEIVPVGEYRTMVRKNFILPDGSHREFVTKEPEGSSSQAVLAITSDNKVVLAKQFRPGPEKIMYEIPGGGREPGETSEQAAVRELREETGYNAGRVEWLGTIHKDAYTNSIHQYYIAYDCTKSSDGQRLDSTEFIEAVEVSIDELFQLAKSASMTDTEVLFLAYDKLLSLKEG